jgi:hypothetical protein
MRKLTYINPVSERIMRSLEERIDFHNDELRRLNRELTKLIEEL